MHVFGRDYTRNSIGFYDTSSVPSAWNFYTTSKLQTRDACISAVLVAQLTLSCTCLFTGLSGSKAPKPGHHVDGKIRQRSDTSNAPSITIHKWLVHKRGCESRFPGFCI